MRFFSLCAVLILPSLVFAANAPTDLKSLLSIFEDLIEIIVKLLLALTFLTIAWGVVRTWIMSDGSAENIEKGKKIVTVGVIAFTIMLSIWGILSLLRSSLFE
jgi:hypothetical protein